LANFFAAILFDFCNVFVNKFLQILRFTFSRIPPYRIAKANLVYEWTAESPSQAIAILLDHWALLSAGASSRRASA